MAEKCSHKNADVRADLPLLVLIDMVAACWLTEEMPLLSRKKMFEA